MAKGRTRTVVASKVEAQINQIIDRTCQALCLDKEKVVKQKSFRVYADARFIIVELIRSKFGEEVPYRYIGKFFNRNNHCFALQSEMWCKELKQTNPEFKRKYEMVVNVLDKNVNIA